VTNPITTFRKDPDAVLDYPVIWSDWLDGDTLSSKSISADTGITVDSSEINGGTVTVGNQSYAANTVVTVWLSGGTAGEEYDVTVSVVTTEGREDDRTFRVIVEER
jgi:hypothetical protein